MEVTIEITVKESAGAFAKEKSVVVSIPSFLLDAEPVADEEDGAASARPEGR